MAGYPPEPRHAAGRPRAHGTDDAPGFRGARNADSDRGERGARYPGESSPDGGYPAAGPGTRGIRHPGNGRAGDRDVRAGADRDGTGRAERGHDGMYRSGPDTSRSSRGGRSPAGYGGGYGREAPGEYGAPFYRESSSATGRGHDGRRRDVPAGGTGHREDPYGEGLYRGGRYTGGASSADAYGEGFYGGTPRRAAAGGPAGHAGAAHAGAAHRDLTGGVEGNERLTGMTGAVLLILFAAEGFTILAIRQMLTLHFFLGMLLVGPVILKASSTVYRFIRYYTGVPAYKRKGPPAPLLRLLGPFVLLLSLSVVGTGVMLAIAGPNAVGLWLFLHKATFVLWFGAMTIHVLAYVWRVPALIGSDLRSRWGDRANEVLGGRRARWLLLLAAVLTGLLLALVTYGRAHEWIGLYGITG